MLHIALTFLKFRFICLFYIKMFKLKMWSISKEMYSKDQEKPKFGFISWFLVYFYQSKRDKNRLNEAVLGTVTLQFFYWKAFYLKPIV